MALSTSCAAEIRAAQAKEAPFKQKFAQQRLRESRGTGSEHTLTYSYPTSDNARKLGFAKTGCYSVRVDEGKPVAFEARQQAEAHIKALGTTPSLYSLDNPRYDENIAQALYETVLPSARTKQATA